jgi:hypothetical protein
VITYFNVPIEPIANRYTIQWREWFDRGFQAHCDGDDLYQTIDGDCGVELEQPSKADFMNPVSTSVFKAQQGSLLIRMIRLVSGALDPDLTRAENKIIVFLHDLYHPVVSQLVYLREVAKLPIKITGVVHAASYVPHDTLAAHAEWSEFLEIVWFGYADTIIVATRYNKGLLEERVVLPRSQVKVCPFPVSLGFGGVDVKLDQIVFPHRLAPEKQPEQFDGLVAAFPHDVGIKTMEQCSSKLEYHAVLAQSKVAFSAALEETFGIAMVEATCRGCIPLVPDRLSYQEMYPAEYRYRSLEEAHTKCEWFLRHYEHVVKTDSYQNMVKTFLDLYEPNKAVSDILQAVTD